VGLGSDVMRTAEPYVRRQRLLARLLSGRVAVIEAGSGYAKSVLAWQYRKLSRPALGYYCDTVIL
jgi:ATP/maltotriose-dependent transcriptional regulator MalT